MIFSNKEEIGHHMYFEIEKWYMNISLSYLYNQQFIYYFLIIFFADFDLCAPHNVKLFCISYLILNG